MLTASVDELCIFLDPDAAFALEKAATASGYRHEQFHLGELVRLIGLEGAIGVAARLCNDSRMALINFAQQCSRRTDGKQCAERTEGSVGGLMGLAALGSRNAAAIAEAMGPCVEQSAPSLELAVLYAAHWAAEYAGLAILLNGEAKDKEIGTRAEREWKQATLVAALIQIPDTSE